MRTIPNPEVGLRAVRSRAWGLEDSLGLTADFDKITGFDKEFLRVS